VVCVCGVCVCVVCVWCVCGVCVCGGCGGGGWGGGGAGGDTLLTTEVVLADFSGHVKRPECESSTAFS